MATALKEKIPSQTFSDYFYQSDVSNRSASALLNASRGKIFITLLNLWLPW